MTDARATETRFIEVQDGRLFVEIVGAGRPVVFVHSGITDSGMWDAQFAGLNLGARIVRYDMRGFGQSSAVGEPYSHVDDLLAVVTSLGIENPTVVAASMGARVAVDLALRNMIEIERMLLVGPALSGVRFEDPELRGCWERMSEAWERGDIESVIDIETRFWINGPERPEGGADAAVIEQVKTMQRRIIELLPETEEDPEIEEPDVTEERLGRLTMPILVVVGEHDVSDIHRNAELIRTSASDANVVVMPNTGHLPSMESSDAFNKLVLDFLAQSPS